MQPFPFSEAMPVSHTAALPDSSDVVVIGGGVIGVTTALYLAQAGHRVTLLEKGRIAAEQSSRNWGWIRQQGRDPDELPLMVEAIGLWQQLAAQTNVDFGLRQTGVTYLARREADLARFEAWLPHAQANGVDTRILGRRETAAMFPGMSGDAAGAMVTPSDMRAEPWAAVPVLAGIARRAGATLIESCAVRCLDLAAGRIAGVVTERGRIATQSVVLAAGAWSSLFLRNHGAALPQLSVRETVAATAPLPEIHAGAAAGSRIAFRRRQDGGYTLAPSGAAELYIGPDAFRALPQYLTQLRSDPFGQAFHAAAPLGFPDAWGTPRRWQADEETPFERMRVLNPAPNARKLKRLVRDFAALFPGLPPVTLRASWAGMIDTLPDLVPVVDHWPGLPGLVVGTGLSGHGFGIGPAVGRALAALATGQAVAHDLARFRSTRFSDGTPVRLGPAL